MRKIISSPDAIFHLGIMLENSTFNACIHDPFDFHELNQPSC